MQTGEDKKLLAYQISGQTCEIDIKTWFPKDLNGNTPFKIIEQGMDIPTGYIDISTIENWNDYGYNEATDYSVVKFSIKGICKIIGWTGLTSVEKDLAIEYYAYTDPTSAVIYLMTEKGMSQAQASMFLTTSWHQHHLKVIPAYGERWDYAKLVVLTYISRDDAEDLFTTVKPLVDLYIEVGVLGIGFNDKQNGIFDYIYSINGFIDIGLEENDYTIQVGTWDDFKYQLVDVLVCGNYIKYNN